MPEIHTVITVYHPEKMKLWDYRNLAGVIHSNILKLEETLDEQTHYNKMLSPKEYNKRLDDIVQFISKLYAEIEEIQKLKVDT